VTNEEIENHTRYKIFLSQLAKVLKDEYKHADFHTVHRLVEVMKDNTMILKEIIKNAS
jgi:hypothetical protein